MKKTTIILLVGAALMVGIALTGCQNQAARSAEPMAATAAPAASSGNAAYDQALSAAKAALKDAARHGGEWRDSGKMLKAAEKAAAAGDYEKAIELANSARLQGEMGKAQAMAEQGVGNPSYLY